MYSYKEFCTISTVKLDTISAFKNIRIKNHSFSIYFTYTFYIPNFSITFSINNFFISSSGSIHSQVYTIVSTLPFISLAISLKLVSPDTGKLNLLISNTIEPFPCDFEYIHFEIIIIMLF